MWCFPMIPGENGNPTYEYMQRHMEISMSVTEDEQHYSFAKVMVVQHCMASVVRLHEMYIHVFQWLWLISAFRDHF